jgi:predicted CXXCH cytochrome family protein
MKGHVFRPLFAIIAAVALILVARALVVPEDFGAWESGFMYGWHRKGNEEDWKNFKVKYQTREYCKDCHADKVELIGQTPHVIIQCENCHGPAVDHPADPPKLAIDRSRQMCLRCHAYLPYATSGRAVIRQISDEEHNPDMECVVCHNPHKPGFD